MATTCVFCGSRGGNSEHVLPNWLTTMGLAVEVGNGSASGWLNRSPQAREHAAPLQTKVKVVCAACNNGWMSKLEDAACRVLTPILRGEASAVSIEDQPILAMWTLKTALVSMMVSSQANRDQGYGLPLAEYAALYRHHSQCRPPDHVQVWMGRFSGERHVASVQATPMIVTEDGASEPDVPHAYVFSVLLGEAFLQGIRFTTPSLGLDVTTAQRFPQIWPPISGLDWPTGDAVTDDTLRLVQKGLNLHPVLAPGLRLQPFRPAVDLDQSTLAGHTVQLPTPCGKHYACYPAALVSEAGHRRFYAFMTMCGCGKAYLVHTEGDGAHFKEEGPAEAVGSRYEALPGEEFCLKDSNGTFYCKRLASS